MMINQVFTSALKTQQALFDASDFDVLSGVSEQTISDIYAASKIIDASKGSTIFIDGEDATRFMLLIEGRIKLFKSNEDGEEAVFGIIEAGRPLVETIIFKETKYPVSAQAIENSKIVSIPANIIRSCLKSDHQFAINLLQSLSNRSQNVMNQFEQITLKSVSQRVGWFLLKRFIENDSKEKSFTLPFDKALIAMFLGMKSETFSRTLQVLKADGIDIEKNVVNLPDLFALCEYCDDDIGSKCSRHGTKDCPNPIC